MYPKNIFSGHLGSQKSLCINKRSCVRVCAGVSENISVWGGWITFFPNSQIIEWPSSLVICRFWAKCGAKQEWIFPAHVLNLNKLSTENESHIDGPEAIHNNTHTHSMLLLILTLFSEPLPKLQQCNQVLITRLWCLQAVWERFMYLCVCACVCAIILHVMSTLLLAGALGALGGY